MTVTDKSSPNSGMPNYCKVTLQKSKLGGVTSLSSKKLIYIMLEKHIQRLLQITVQERIDMYLIIELAQ